MALVLRCQEGVIAPTDATPASARFTPAPARVMTVHTCWDVYFSSFPLHPFHSLINYHSYSIISSDSMSHCLIEYGRYIALRHTVDGAKDCSLARHDRAPGHGAQAPMISASLACRMREIPLCHTSRALGSHTCALEERFTPTFWIGVGIHLLQLLHRRSFCE